MSNFQKTTTTANHHEESTTTVSSNQSNNNDRHDDDISSPPPLPVVGETPATTGLNVITNQSYPISFPTITTNSNDRTQIRAALNEALGANSPTNDDEDDDDDDEKYRTVNWTTVHCLLLQLGKLSTATFAANNNQPLRNFYEIYDASSSSAYEEDPLGRIFLTRLVARNPPMECVDAALQAFPHAVSPSNPVVFFTACSSASTEIIARMVQHMVAHGNGTECPYPWLLSPYISLEAAQTMLQVYPQGAWQQASAGSAFLTSNESSYNVLDYMLFSSAMTERREFDEVVWQKFKLILVAAENNGNGNDISPVHTVLDRMFARPDCLEDPDRAQHILWFLHQLRSSDEWIFQKHRPQLNEGSEGLFPLHLLLSHKCIASSQMALVAARELCKLLIEADSLAVMHGIGMGGALYPFHLAIQNGWPCHDLLLSVWPESIEYRDPRTGLLPFQAALSTPSEAKREQATGPDLSLNIAFELLRANPTMVTSCASADDAIVMMDIAPIAAGNTAVSGVA